MLKARSKLTSPPRSPRAPSWKSRQDWFRTFAVWPPPREGDRENRCQAAKRATGGVFNESGWSGISQAC